MPPWGRAMALRIHGGGGHAGHMGVWDPGRGGGGGVRGWGGGGNGGCGEEVLGAAPGYSAPGLEG